MGWIVGIAQERGSLRVVELTEKGRAVVPLLKASLKLSARNPSFRIGEFTDLAFADLLPCDDADAFDRLGIPEEVRQVQTVFRFKRGRKTFYIPSQVLIAGLFCQNALTRESLLTASGFEMLGMLVDAPDGAIAVEPSRWMPGARKKLTPSFASTMLWTACYPSAKRMVASVFDKALEGRFDLALPAGRASLSFPGLQVGDEVLAQNLLVEWVQPDESPLAGLKGRVPDRLVFRERKTGAKVGMHRRKPSTEDDLVLGAAGWHLSDDEWMVISAILTSTMSPTSLKGRGLGNDGRRKTEVILRKLSEGVSWLTVGKTQGEGSNASVYFGGLRRDGRWARIKQYLREERSPD